MDLFSPSIFEIVMLICFGCSWPFAIVKTLRTRTVKGVSLIFMTLIFIGYLSGIAYKLLAHFDGVIWLYIANGSMVFTEILLYLRYARTKERHDSSKIPRWSKGLHRSNLIHKGEAYGL